MQFITPDWQAPANIKAFVTMRAGGVSQAPYESFNLATHVGDNRQDVQTNRAILKEQLKLPDEPLWLNQVHGIEVADSNSNKECDADAFYTDLPQKVGVVMTADCLPVLIAADNGQEVALAHAGWRGLLEGIIEASVNEFQTVPSNLHVWLGPAIGPESFQVGDEVRQAFIARNPEWQDDINACFKHAYEGKWLADIYKLATLRLQKIGVTKITGGNHCTMNEKDRFYSYRRDGVTGRMASLIWME